MSRDVILPRVFHNAIGHGDPIYAMDDGELVVTQTVDAWGFDFERRADRDTAQSAELGRSSSMAPSPGDAVDVRIDRMTPMRTDRLDLRPGRQQCGRSGRRVSPACAPPFDLEARSRTWNGATCRTSGAASELDDPDKTDDRVPRRRAGAWPSHFDRDQRALRRQYGLPALRSWRHRSVSGVHFGSDVLSRRRPRIARRWRDCRQWN